ncbi:DUF1344 domain-containing protein [Jiella sonneratiae]|uniref:DUF1344 domain-containing protein n=1 Tax=Jiella sonneratiae TaxID=2816856 RepID=A0ABS3JA16_9HYPH|nr:DUF1344 domain-containing protein [Jiella sonneratiae]MBO0905768.1 DUF1344 domain-containing protein [Jiella sonneratiae]
MRRLTLSATLAAGLIAATSAFAASPTMSSDAMAGSSKSATATSSATPMKHVAAKTSTHVATGKIKSIDTAANMLTLTNGKKFTLPADFAATSYKTGERVKVKYQTGGKQMAALSVVAAK